MREDDPKSNEPKRPIIAWVFTIGSLLLSSGNGFIAWMDNTPTRFDAGLAILTATLIAVIWYTQYTYESLQHSRSRDKIERRRSRKSLATGLLAEIQWLEGLLERIYANGAYFSQHESLSHPLLNRSISETRLFKPCTVAMLAKFYAMLRGLQDVMNVYRSSPEEIFGPRGKDDYYAVKKQYNDLLQRNAWYTIVEIPQLVEALMQEGGTLPKLDYPDVVGKELPKLPPGPFGPRKIPE